MKIVVPVKYVPEPTSTWRFADDLTLDRRPRRTGPPRRPTLTHVISWVCDKTGIPAPSATPVAAAAGTATAARRRSTVP